MSEGSEQGWAEASHDSRRHMKQRDIKRTVQKMQNAQVAQREAHEKQMEDDYFEGALEFAKKLREDAHFGYSRRYAAGYEKAFAKEK